ncbi:hypothetical protein J7438_11870 [Thalassotalea sp. G20_0]|uniref:hypothetical protein n=1 Tax=Thalassotalea sp. G20_0 TaxID=2821093 RepID=UPI001ADCC30D|nr:hypothetical protein [Thalassotalea sp. G20_0]MBO9494774.1 hypothetical protein [Thalassotalea sp. G20_0]
MISSSSSPVSSPVTVTAAATAADQPSSYEEAMAQKAVSGSHDVQSASSDATISLKFQTTVPILSETSQKANANVDTHKVSAVAINSANSLKSLKRPSTDNSALEPPSREALKTAASTFIANSAKRGYCPGDPQTHGAAARPLDLYSVSHSDDSEEQKNMSKLALCELVQNNVEGFNIIFPYVAVPGCGRLNPVRFLNVMLCLCESAYQDAFPKTVISIGSGQAFLEKCFGLMGGVNVKCYDREPLTRFLPVEQAEFPKDINKCLPEDCSSCLLVSAYPQGYLGPVLAEFIRRGGEMLCTTVEGGLFCSMHEGYEDNPDILRDGIKELRRKNGEFFQVQLNDYSLMGSPSFIQFYNWPSSVKQLMFDSQRLKGLCSDIEFPGILTSSSR